MKAVLLLGCFTVTMMLTRAQKSDIALNKEITENIKERKQWLLRHEKTGMTDIRTGRMYSADLSFYFDKVRRQLQSVYIKEAQKHGLEIVYTYYQNQLVKAVVTPPEEECRRCIETYYYWNNQLLSIGDTTGKLRNANLYIQNAAFLKAKVPDVLGPEYFGWEEPIQTKNNAGKN